MKKTFTLGVLFLLAVGVPLQAATVGREEMRDGEKHLILENESAKVVVWPDAGGAITEFVDKRSGHDFATKGVKKGVAGTGLKELTALYNHDISPDNERIGAHPFKAELREGKGYRAIIATCTLGHLRAEREMRLADDSTRLTVILRHTNISDMPHPVWMRFHPFIAFDDSITNSAAVLVPGPGPDAIRSVRRFPLEGGYTDANFMDTPGYWMVANPFTGAGIWMTFIPDNIMVASVWTTKKNVVAEFFPQVRMVAPGETIELSAAYQPFVTADKNNQLTMEFVPQPEQANALRFLDRVRPNLEAVCSHTMVALPSGGPENLFHFMHRRRDRFAICDWGIADAMMHVPSTQANAIRMSLFARAFNGQTKPVELGFRLTIADALDKVVKRQEWPCTLTPPAKPIMNERQDVSLADLPDGRYTFTLDVFNKVDPSKTIHSYSEKRKLAGRQKAAVAEARVKAEKGVTLKQRERPFVTALRTMDLPSSGGGKTTVPIGVEEASGIARTNWPVRVGVPFAAGALATNAPVAITAPDGKPVPVQTTVMGTWLDGSVKWLLAEFMADAPSNNHLFYTLKTNTQPPPSPGAVAVQEGETIRVDTGVSKWSFQAGDTKVLGLFSPDDIWWKTADGREYRFQARGEEAGISLEETGPLKAVVKIVGWYFPKGGTNDSRPVARGEFRAEFYRGQAWYRIYHTFTFTGNPWSDSLAGTGVRFSGLLQQADGAGIDLDGATVGHANELTLWQPDEDHGIISSGKAEVRSGRRSTGAAALTAGNKRFVVYHRHLWEMFPKLVDVNAAGNFIAFEYWPTLAGALDWRPKEDYWHSSSSASHYLAMGVSRTHEFIVDPAGSYALHQYRSIFDEPVVAAVPPRYLCATRALLHLQPYDPDKVPDLEFYLSEVIDSYDLNRDVYGWYGQWHFGTLHNRFEGDGWAVYGRYANLYNEQDILHLPWLAYLRSGDRKYLKFAENNTKHLMEVGTIRWNPLLVGGVGMSRRHHECPWLGGADYGHSMLDPFLELYHATGYRPAFEASERMAMSMASQRGGADRYLSNPVNGLTRMYLETQNPFYKEQADRLWKDLCVPDRNWWFGGDHGARMAICYSQVNDECKKLWKQMADGDKNPPFQELDSLARLYEQTGDKRYAQKVLARFRQTQTHQGSDPRRSDPLLWGIKTHTQHVLAELRQMVYASGAIDGAIREERELFGDRGEPQPLPGTWVKEPLRCVVREDQDQEIRLNIIGTVGNTNGFALQAFGPDGKLISRTTVPVGRHFPFTIKLPKDGRTGQYVVFIDWNNNVSLPLTTLPEVYLIQAWSSLGRYFTRSPASAPCEITIGGGERFVAYAADKLTCIGYTDKVKKEERLHVGPEGAWLWSGDAGVTSSYAADKSPLVVSVNANRWFWPDPKSLEVKPIP